MKFLIPSLLALIFVSCSIDENKDNDLAKKNLKGKVKSLQEATLIGEKFGAIKEGKLLDIGPSTSYNSDGNLIREPDSDFSDFTTMIYYEYDNNKLLLNKSFFKIDDGTLKWKIIYQYNESNLKTKETTYDSSGNISHTISYNYVDNQLMEENDIYYPDRDNTFWEIDGVLCTLLNKTAKYQYNINGKLQQESRHYECRDTSNHLIINDNTTITYRYNDQGDKTEKYVKCENGLFQKTLYYYNKAGMVDNEISSTNFTGQHGNSNIDLWIIQGGNHVAQRMEVKYSYDNDNNKIEEQIIYNDNLNELHKYEYEYDKHGNWIKKISQFVAIFITLREITYYDEKDTVNLIDSLNKVMKKQEIRDKSCNIETAQDEVKAWMGANYPDWEINSDFHTTEVNDCIYNVQFTAINPLLKDLNIAKTEVIIIQFKYTEKDFSKVHFSKIRGLLY